nr:hypothetical protein [Candidatus Gracilibacteria bacterium]
MTRIEMNSLSLQKHFSEVYRDFFARNDLVLSGCFNFPWGYESGNNSETYIRMKSALPLRYYVGIKLKNDLKVKFNNISFFDILGKKFEVTKYINVNKEEKLISELLQNELNKLGLKTGIEIELLSETSRGHSFGFSGTSAAIISYGIYKIFDFLNGKSFIKNADFLETNFKKIFSLAGKIDYISRYGDTYGHNSIFTLKPSNGISFLLTNKIDFDEEFIDKIDKIPFEYKSIENNDIDLPFDYFIIFSGLPTDTKQVEYYKKLELSENDLSEFVKNDLKNIDDYTINKFKDNYVINSTKFDIINIENLKTLNYFFKIYKKPYNENLINSFIESINNRRGVIGLLEKQSGFADDFNHFFRNNRSNYNEIMGISPAYSGKLGGGYIVVTKSGLSRNTILKTINDLKLAYPNVEIEYCSYIDGPSNDGVLVEQFISNEIYSKYIDKNKIQYKDNKGNNYLGDYSDLIEKQNNGLLFDMINNKIYLNGEKLTSKDIHSQNTTIEIVTKLLENIGEEISNKEFSVSSYSTNKNEMLGKIILPLIKLIEEKTGEKLSLVCKGSITDFYVKMGEINLTIGIIKKL